MVTLELIWTRMERYLCEGVGIRGLLSAHTRVISFSVADSRESTGWMFPFWRWIIDVHFFAVYPIIMIPKTSCVGPT